MSEQLELPVLVGGQRIETAPEYYKLPFDTGCEVVMPRIELAQLQPSLDPRGQLIAKLEFEEIVGFFNGVAEAWQDPNNTWRQLALEWGPKVTGFSPSSIESDVLFLGGAMHWDVLSDIVQSDLGDPAYLNEWTRYKGIFHRAWPKGLVAHIVVGNVPLAGFFTIVRSLITKNVTVAKLSKRDPVTPQCLAQCIYDVDPTHPVTRALSAMYWEPESELEDAVLEAADVVSVWGRATSIESIKRRAPYNTDVVEFGPKRSFALFLDNVEDWDRAGLWLGLDVVNYEQEACFSMQEAFVVGDPKPLAESLVSWLSSYAEHVPPYHTTVDAKAHVQRVRMEAVAAGWQVMSPDDAAWTVVVTDGPCQVEEHPLSRTIFVHPVDDVAQVIDLVDENVQTVAVEPMSRIWEVADQLTGAGADRLVSVGRSGRMRAGFIHDGFHPLRRMVRWSSIERDHDCLYHFPLRNPADEEQNYREWAQGRLPSALRFFHTGNPWWRELEGEPDAPGDATSDHA